MATDYLENMFPSYVLTQDTTVVPLKNYYRLDGGIHKRVLDAVASDNPHEKGWYQRTANHAKEYRYNLMSYQVNNIANICQGLGNKMTQFPKWALPRQTTDGTTTLDWRSSFFDTMWNEVIGDCLTYDYTMPFKVNMFYSAHLNELARKIAIKESYTTLLEQFIALDPEPEVHGKNYRAQGYLFDASSMGNVLRADDTYTCVVNWAETNFRGARLFIQNERDRFESTSTTYRQLNHVVDTMDACARTIVDIALHVASVRINDAKSFTCKTVTVPIWLTGGTVPLYKLCFKEQLVVNALYGNAHVDDKNNVVVYETRREANPTAKFITLNLPSFGSSPYPVEKEELYNFVQDGNVWYTNIPFGGTA